MIRIKRTNDNFEREALISPFGFKGGYVSEVWQSVVRMESQSGQVGLGLGTQSPLWSDADVFAGNSPASGNALMYLMTSFALRAAKDIPFETPFELLDAVLPMTHDYGIKITGRQDLRLTFALNSLVSVDNAAWQLYCAENGIQGFDEMIPDTVRPALSYRQQRLAAVPLMTYGIPTKDIVQAVDDGFFFLKIKIGSNPAGDGDLDKMLEWDKARLSEIHAAVKDRTTEHTEDGRIPYYLDANGRYDSRERLMRLLDHAEKIGALERIILLEEPFPEEYKIDVSGIPVRLAADESAHSDKDAVERIEMGYKAIALKPIAKTMSMSLRILEAAHSRDIPCFCADLTVNPILVDWNKNVAARLKPLPGMRVGVLESNGHQNYSSWELLKSYHTRPKGSWIVPERGLFHLDESFYQCSGGFLEQSQHYLQVTP
ncbi:MAG TPA: enolase C-terminal domain-like protein [Armatimonadota bacterium]